MVQIQVFDEENEIDLMEQVNRFLKELKENEFIDIRYSIAAFSSGNSEQVYCYSALILYRVMIK